MSNERKKFPIKPRDKRVDFERLVDEVYERFPTIMRRLHEAELKEQDED